MVMCMMGMMWVVWVAGVELEAVEAPWVRMCMGVSVRMRMGVCPSSRRTHV